MALASLIFYVGLILGAYALLGSMPSHGSYRLRLSGTAPLQESPMPRAQGKSDGLKQRRQKRQPLSQQLILLEQETAMRLPERLSQVK